MGTQRIRILTNLSTVIRMVWKHRRSLWNRLYLRMHSSRSRSRNQPDCSSTRRSMRISLWWCDVSSRWTVWRMLLVVRLLWFNSRSVSTTPGLRWIDLTDRLVVELDARMDAHLAVQRRRPRDPRLRAKSRFWASLQHRRWLQDRPLPTVHAVPPMAILSVAVGLKELAAPCMV